jgi:hypothetical protein
MELNNFPRPSDDTGIGIQWSLGYPARVGVRRLEQRWIPLLKTLGVKWVKFRHHGGLDLARLLHDHDIMSIVHIWPRPAGPARLSPSELESIRSYVDAGVRYFELGPDRLQALSPSSASASADRETRLSDLCANLETILREGGLPGLPAPHDMLRAAGDIAAICEMGREDLLRGGTWQAYHIAAGNLPLDFPDDAVSQTGKPLSEDEFRRGFAESWAGSTWGGRTRDAINNERLRRRNPDASIQSTPAGWRAYEALDTHIRQHLKRSIPILGTSGGCFVGEMTDPRYPTVSPNGHAARTLEMARIMMGASQRFEPAPGYLFCAAFSILGNYALAHFEPRWESLAWISPTRKNGRLPIIDPLAHEPKRSRLGEEAATIRGSATSPFMMPVGTRQFVASQESDMLQDMGDADEELDLVAPTIGRPLRELLTPPEWEVGGGEGEPAPVIPATFAAEPFDPEPSAAVVGRLAGGAGQSVTLRHTRDAGVLTQKVTSSGTFAFRELRPGEYSLTVEQTNLRVDGIQVTSNGEQQLDLTMPEWTWQITQTESDQGFSIVRCSVEGRSNLPVRVWNPTWAGIERRTGSKPEYGPFYCELAPLGPGRYYLQVEGISPYIELALESHSITWIEFVRVATREPAAAPAPPIISRDKGLHRYLLVARPFANKEDLMAALRFMRVHQPACGFSIEEARWAEEVIIVGADGLRVTERDQALLNESGCRIRRIDENIADTLNQLADMGEPFFEQSFQS